MDTSGKRFLRESCPSEKGTVIPVINSQRNENSCYDKQCHYFTSCSVHTLTFSHNFNKGRAMSQRHSQHNDQLTDLSRVDVQKDAGLSLQQEVPQTRRSQGLGSAVPQLHQLEASLGADRLQREAGKQQVTVTRFLVGQPSMLDHYVSAMYWRSRITR